MTSTRQAEQSSSVLRVGVAAGVGTSLELYDFTIYGTAAALVFGDVFFKTGDAWLGTFLSLSTFAAGFVMAPLGAAVFGWIGDRKGRRTALSAAFLLMGLATLGMGVLPAYAVIGVAAPLLLVTLRLLHGVARGGESAGAAVLAIEHAPVHRRGVYGSFVALGSPVGTILANFAFAMVLFLPDEEVRDWGWRLPFLAGGLVLLLGLWVRKGVAESPVFQKMVADEAQDTRVARPLLDVIKSDWRRIALTAGVNIGLTATTFTLLTFMLSYATASAPEGLGLPRQAIVNGSLLGLACHAILNITAAWLSDRIGRKPVMLTGAVLSLAAALVMFPIAAAGTVFAVNTAVVLGFVGTGVLFGPMYTFFAEAFPREKRQSGVGLGYHLGAVLGGGITPMIANRIIAGTGEPLNVGYYLAALLTLSLVCLLFLPETAPARLARAARRESAPAAR
ncbi:Major Facilitator Superfamily protein [Saccharopolyspora antimicrobica]|uniref:MFS transporter n=1 Tax=Saccharopolyspora antimicrobica TaxID=455193 RepID=A0A1I5H001_9PSEU|nr:MFS transporter [Saccharopolyspora antimicrobica]RKT90052.1 MFS transporter [Saccharopolyspora antimicrobica]SFO41624.1 Major Facilitator Superfamily protein [Saccharopolyspora antimicrobica]